ncbi:EamA family transporter [Rhodobacterales bacterium HKCCE2091]|nr:EamA family transporter [Rhodobacterales bacterium HKCCE2091]
MIGSIVSFSTMAVAGRQAGLRFDTFEIMTYRSAVGFGLLLLILVVTGRLPAVRTRRPGLHAVRNVAHFTGQNLWFYALSAIPLAQVFALEFTSPLLVLLLAALFLGERMTPVKVVAAAIGFLGVLLVLRPDRTPVSPGHLAAFAAALGFAVTAILTKRLTRTESVLTIMFWLTATQLVFGIVAGLVYDGRLAWPGAADWPWLVLIGICGLTAHFSLTTALSLAPASVVMPIDFVRLPIIAMIGAAIYNEDLQWPVFAGAALIFGANYANILDGQRRARAERMPAPADL